MNELLIRIDSENPVEFYGINDRNLFLIKKRFPKLKIVARGDTLKVLGEQEELDLFEKRIQALQNYYSTGGKLSEDVIDQIMSGNESQVNVPADSGDVIVFGNNGIIVKARTANQRKMVESAKRNDIIFAIGPAGTGKTYTAVAMAVRALKNKEVRKIVLCRPAVEAGESLGFLPGDLKEKLDPYLQPLYDALYDMIPPEKMMNYIENRTVEIAPLAFMRGRTLDHAYVILDEAQNATEGQLKMFLTRMGSTAKFVITGDVTQIDLPRNQPSGLANAFQILGGINGIDFIHLDGSDVVRHRLVKSVIDAYAKTKGPIQPNV
ncbi:MAG: PhoH family protein [Bacteroidetes bacterium]|nr:PhoH family protein [Bacteroidota bacterium]